MGGMKARQEGDSQRGLPTSGLGGSRAVVVPRPGSQTENGAHASSPGVETTPNVGQAYVHGLRQIRAWLPLGFSSTRGAPQPRGKEGTDL